MRLDTLTSHLYDTTQRPSSLLNAAMLRPVLLESILKNGAQAGDPLAAMLQQVELAQGTAGHLPREPALAHLVADHRTLIDHLVYRAGLVQKFQVAPWARVEVLAVVQDLQAHQKDTSGCRQPKALLPMDEILYPLVVLGPV